jgi:hypothetical protein
VWSGSWSFEPTLCSDQKYLYSWGTYADRLFVLCRVDFKAQTSQNIKQPETRPMRHVTSGITVPQGQRQARRVETIGTMDEAGGTRWRRVNGEPANGAGLAYTIPYTGRTRGCNRYARQQMHIRCMPMVTCSIRLSLAEKEHEYGTLPHSGELDFTPLGERSLLPSSVPADQGHMYPIPGTRAESGKAVWCSL